MQTKSHQFNLNNEPIDNKATTKNKISRLALHCGIACRSMLSLTVAAGLKLSQVIVNNNRGTQFSCNRLADSAIDQIQQEIRNGELIDLETELPKGYV